MHHQSKMLKQSNEEQDLSDMKVRNCDTAKRRVQSLRIIDEEAAGIASIQLGDLSSSWCSLDSFKPVCVEAANKYFLVHKVTLSSPSPALCFVETVPQDGQNSHITAFNSGDGSSKSDNESASSKTMRDVHISTRLMEDFLDLAKENSEKDLETCGILGAFLTHPSQSCFMSSVDLHTQYSYQVMIPEAFAIVLAPNDTSRSCGLFRLTDPDGMNILKNCQEQGFHPHNEPDNGNPVYEHCSNVYKNSNLRFEIFDLR
ncbi:AMSH-like ubiquitin thioesterase 2 isoform X4 [Gastrolobium bilobum]|uniref:AMSH-like ubiquitin thioesterase 2 isoform X4 n=1 Tax=Gastrolobium bilobum TaxID=150636 RepID=UPI002AAFF3C9|nr:AMSH-like ubiquitin thioesterase 2 isoform X4 [Gastrolobium bilobum]